MYSSEATFVVRTRTQQTAGVVGMAAQMGIPLPSSDPTQSPDFYSALLHSRSILGAIATGPYSVGRSSGQKAGDLAAMLDLDEADRRAIEREAIEWLDKHLKTRIDTRTGLVTLTATAPDPRLAQAIAARALTELNTFNLVRRRSQASAERQFTEARLNAVRVELREAESRLSGFRESNRVINTPTLHLREDQLQRSVSVLQQVYGDLATSYEQAKIEEVRDNPVINVVDAPEIALRPDGRGVVIATALGLVAGGLFGLLVILTSRRVVPMA